MGLFGTTSPFDSDVEKATSENNTSEQWGLILDVCDKASKSSDDAKNCLRSIFKRLNHADPHVAIQAATLLDACVNNCGKTFHIEVASREFENEYVKLIKKCHPKVAQKLKEYLKKWSQGDFKTDQQLNLIPTLYVKLRSSGIDFTTEMPTKKSVTLSKDPNVVQSQEEEDQIAKAIELSLKETSSLARTAVTTSSSLYPTDLTANLSNTASATTPAKELRKVRALYDFEAAEDNELTFSAGELILVSDDSDANWWKGTNQRGEGLFPANFVTADLSVEPEQLVLDKVKKLVKFQDNVEVKEERPLEVEINEEKLDRLLHLLHEADPTNPDEDGEEMLQLEKEVTCMGPLIDTELEKVDCKHAQLTKLSSDLVEALSLYHTLMREPQYAPMNKLPYGYSTNIPTTASMYNGNLPQPPPGMAPYMGPYNMPGPDRSYLPPHLQHLPPGHVQLPPPGLQQSGLPVSLPPQGTVPSSQQNIMPVSIGSRTNFPNYMPTIPQPGMTSYGPQMMNPASYLLNTTPSTPQIGTANQPTGTFSSSSNTHM